MIARSDLAVGTALEPQEYGPLTLTDFVRYQGASGDFNPIHHDTAFAQAAGIPGERIVMHGNNKSLAELREALVAGVRHINVDSFDELDRLEVLRAEGIPVPRVALRITPGVEAHTHEFIATGQDDSKFGFNLGNGDAARAVARAQRSSAVDLIGLHCHIGSNVFAASSFARWASSLPLHEVLLEGDVQGAASAGGHQQRGEGQVQGGSAVHRIFG